MSNMHKCNKGWIMAPDEAGNENLPFFVQVRDKDIHWNPDNSINDVIQSVIDGITNNNGNIHAVFPNGVWKFTINGWDITLSQDLSFDAYRKFNMLTDIYASSSKSENSMTYSATIPMNVNADTFMVHGSIMGEYQFDKSSIVTFSGINSGTSTSSTFRISVTNTEMELNNTNIKNTSFITVHCHGTCVK